jgi:ADP-heptose:LPS heptosyltransferase
LALKTTLTTIPSAVPYVRSDPSKVAAWNTRLGERMKPRIGLAWSGNPNHVNDRNRSIRLAELLRRLPAGFQYVSLQKNVPDIDVRALEASSVLNVAGQVNDFSDTAALCDCLDLVLTVDTSVAHLSAALGRPTWVLLHFNADWRWLLDRVDSPWYPTATLYRQRTLGDWGEVFARLRHDVVQMFSRGFT